MSIVSVHIRALDGTMALIIHRQLMLSIPETCARLTAADSKFPPAADVSNTTQKFTFLISCEDDATLFISAEEKEGWR